MSVERRRTYDYVHERRPEGAYAVLVDRVWPRGISKQSLAADEWLRELAPSSELRRWFGHRSERWGEFQRRYRRELHARAAALQRLRQLAASRRLILLYSARDQQHNQAVVLQQLLERE